MKISELIAELEIARQDHGDLDVAWNEWNHDAEPSLLEFNKGISEDRIWNREHQKFENQKCFFIGH